MKARLENRHAHCLDEHVVVGVFNILRCVRIFISGDRDFLERKRLVEVGLDASSYRGRVGIIDLLILRNDGV